MLTNCPLTGSTLSKSGNLTILPVPMRSLNAPFPPAISRICNVFVKKPLLFSHPLGIDHAPSSPPNPALRLDRISITHPEFHCTSRSRAAPPRLWLDGERLYPGFLFVRLRTCAPPSAKAPPVKAPARCAMFAIFIEGVLNPMNIQMAINTTCCWLTPMPIPGSTTRPSHK